MRPSELSAVRVCNVDLRAGTLRVLESLDDGARGDVKTETSDRTVRLTEQNVEILRALLPLHPNPQAAFFQDVRGRHVEAGNVYMGFVEAQRSVDISPIRDLYSTKDTYLSLCLTAGVDLAWLSSQTGVNQWTIKKHYGRFMHRPDRDALELAKIAPSASAAAPLVALPGRKKRRQKPASTASAQPLRVVGGKGR